MRRQKRKGEMSPKGSIIDEDFCMHVNNTKRHALQIIKLDSFFSFHIVFLDHGMTPTIKLRCRRKTFVAVNLVKDDGTNYSFQ